MRKLNSLLEISPSVLLYHFDIGELMVPLKYQLVSSYDMISFIEKARL